MRILALDVATVTGVCDGVAGEEPTFSTVRFGSDGEEHEEAFERALRWIAERLRDHPPDAVRAEATINLAAFMRFNPKTKKAELATTPATIIRLTGLSAVIAAAVKVKGIPYEHVRVGTARKGFIGHGNLKGPEAKRRSFEMCKLIGWHPSNRDESDAGAIWFHGVSQLAPHLLPRITPMDQAAIAMRIGGVEIDDPTGLFKKAGVRG
jgi:hypothetical protein